MRRPATQVQDTAKKLKAILDEQGEAGLRALAEKEAANLWNPNNKMFVNIHGTQQGMADNFFAGFMRDINSL